MWAFKLGKSSWQNVCVSVWERQEEEVTPRGRSSKNKGVEMVIRMPVFTRIKK